MSLPVRTWVDQGIGLDIFCVCGRSGYVSAADAVMRLDLDLTFDQVAWRLVCSVCGAKGRPALDVRFAIGDYYRDCRLSGGRIP